MLIPFDYLDTICLAATSRQHGISSAPVWQLFIDGEFDEQVARDTLRALCRRYPILASRAVPMQPGRSLLKSRRIAYRPDERPDMDRLFRVVDLRDRPNRFPEIQQEAFDNFIDMETDYPARVTWARTSGTGGVLLFQQHHGIADGRAFF